MQDILRKLERDCARVIRDCVDNVPYELMPIDISQEEGTGAWVYTLNTGEILCKINKPCVREDGKYIINMDVNPHYAKRYKPGDFDMDLFDPNNVQPFGGPPWLPPIKE